LSAADKSKIETAVAGVKEALKGTDGAAIKAASDKLNEAWQAASAELYKSAQQARGGGPGAGPGAGGPQGGPTGGGTHTESSPSGGEAGGKDEGPIIDAEVVDEKK
jgi:molecular chaperone DnaK